MTRIIIFSLFLAVYASFSAFAENRADITKDMIVRKNKAIEATLNNRGDALGMIRVLHNSISEDAIFRLTVSNPMHNNGARSPVMEMKKEDYINTYIQGTHFIDGYQITIETDRFEYDPVSARAISTDHITESGIMTAPANDNKPFISRTTCRTEHKMSGGDVVSTGATCHTVISLEETV